MNCLGEYISSLKKKDEIRKNRYTGKPSEDNFDINKPFDLADVTVLTKKSGRDFVVLNLSDVHFTDYKDIMETAPKRSFPTPLTVARLIKSVKPDLITITGDIVCGKSTVYSVNNFTALMECFGIPWAPVFGNHDGEGNCDLNYLADVMSSAPHCLMKKGDPEMGVGNYVVAVKDEKDNLTNAFVMMDSRHHADGERNGQPNELQHKWFKWVTDGIRNLSNGKAEAAVFTHIPLPEYEIAYDNAWDYDNKRWKTSDAVGFRGEEVACHTTSDRVPIQKGFFELIKSSEITKFVFTGHDHLNSFSVMYEGVRLSYVMKISKSAGRQLGYDGGLVITIGNEGIKELDYKTVSYGVMRSAHKIKTNY